MSVSLAAIEEQTCIRFNVTRAKLHSRSQHYVVAHPRMIVMYLGRQITPMSLPQIGRYFDRDHTTVLHATRRVPKLLAERADMSQHVAAIRVAIETGRDWRTRSALELMAARAIADGLAGKVTEIMEVT